ncbi:sugar-transfer associated ATP-grasp domain-containing protein [Flagellimonas pacifica]|uniref:Sugar-transfer associated ATP-grasp n=1 Tax=Flagellimonas pacifica TaxID=1247520 RepID=A0A285MR06_9FLAO|nr:sugar-transfer associated ATP-grasp domain-containing protein [Allomuricauda parva]SNY99619.1 Sugar-transfer associated ATP-grasp [Allomuricauda parva]
MIPKHQKEGFRVFLKDKRKKSYPKIFLEFLSLWREKGEIPLYYFKYLYRKDVTNVKDFLITKEASKIQRSRNLHKEEYLSIISNKLIFSLFCKKNNLPVPELISYNFGSSFYYEGKCYKVSNNRELTAFFKEVFNKTGKEKLFLKPFSLFGGRGACIIRKNKLEEDVKENASSIIENDCIHEDVLIQHDEVNKINPSCINTIRFETYIDDKKGIHVLDAFMRFGTGDNIVDNGHSGGIYVGVNMQEGRLKDVALEEIHFGGRDYFEHPTSNYPFKGFLIPYFNEARNLVIEATEFLPDRFIGWDIAITNNGPVIIEANEYPDLFMGDTSYGGYLKNPLFKEMLAEAG